MPDGFCAEHQVFIVTIPCKERFQMDVAFYAIKGGGDGYKLIVSRYSIRDIVMAVFGTANHTRDDPSQGLGLIVGRRTGGL